MVEGFQLSAPMTKGGGSEDITLVEIAKRMLTLECSEKDDNKQMVANINKSAPSKSLQCTTQKIKKKKTCIYVLSKGRGVDFG
jgi:hypothetical protein